MSDAYWKMLPKYFHTCKRFSIFIIIALLTITSTANPDEGLLEGHLCTFGGTTTFLGVCKKLHECPEALSNFRAGINPVICYVEDDRPFVCCPTEKRISEIKCAEFDNQIREVFGLTDQPKTMGCFNRKQMWALTKISGGRDALPNEMSYMVALGYYDEAKEETDWKCGGALISEQYILTAAHCLTGVQQTPTRVLLGVKNLNTSVSSRIEAFIEKIHIHPEYKRSTKYNDIGLIKLDRTITFSQDIYPACLPQPSKRLELIGTTQTAGWGRLEFFGKRDEMLKVTNLNRYSMKDCNKNYVNDDNSFDLRSKLPDGFTKSQICAGDKNGNNDTCDGDSGGPLVVKKYITDCVDFIVGITSFGSQFCGSGLPAIYSNVQSYIDWLEDIVWQVKDTYIQ